MNQNLTRAQADPKWTWRLEDLYADDKLWEQDYDRVRGQIAQVAALRGKLDGAHALLQGLDAIFSLQLAAQKLYTYAHMRRDEDNGNTAYQGMTDRAMGLLVALDADTSFLVPEIQAMGEKALGYLEQEPGLQPYSRFIKEALRLAPHTLSPEMERLLASAGEMASAPDTIYSMLCDADMRFPTIKGEDGNQVEITHGRFIPLMESRSRAVRQAAYEGLYDTYKSQANTIMATYGASVRKDWFFARARNYASTREASLFPNCIPETVYDALIVAVRRHLPALHRYVALRKKALGLDQLSYYDLYVPIVPKVEMGVPYEEAARLVQEGLSPLGEQYTSDLKKAFTDGWIDVYENTGKTSGAYSWGVYGTHPYVLLNYQQNLDSIFTLAHELGHAMHSYYSDQSQPYAKAEYPLFLAEIASTTNENLVLEALKQRFPGKEQQMALCNHQLEQIRATVYRQTMFAEFEREAHRMAGEDRPLTRDVLCEMYAKLNQDYHGEGVAVDERIPYEWMRIPHFYRAFYVYQYATGFSAAVAFSRKLLRGGPQEREKYLGFLKAGDSRPPLDTLRAAGVDMESPQPVEECLAAFEDALVRLQALMEEE